MDGIQKSVFSSLFLHSILFGFVLWHHSPFSGRKTQVPLAPRAMMVDFVKIAPKSGAPTLGPAHKVTTQKAIPAHKVNQAAHRPSSQKSEKKNTSKPKKVPNLKAVPQKKTNGKQEQKKSSKPSKTSTKPQSKAHNKGIEKAKVNLSPTKKADSIGSLLAKKVSSSEEKTGIAETYADELTGTEMDLLNRHMKRFWNMPSGHETASNLIVEVELFIRRDGSIEKAHVIDEARIQKDPEFRLAAECALRAVLDPECSPLPLPLERYDAWKHMIFVFDPREMCR